MSNQNNFKNHTSPTSKSQDIHSDTHGDISRTCSDFDVKSDVLATCDFSKGSGDSSKGSGDFSKGSGDFSKGSGDFSKGSRHITHMQRP